MTADRMPLNIEGDLTQAREDFCLALKAARKKKGLALADIAVTTKIPASLFEGLEHGDLHRWPKALFRRSFFRDYARAIGLPVEETCAEFVRLFPDEEAEDLSKLAALKETERVAASQRVPIGALVVDMVISAAAAVWKYAREAVPPVMGGDHLGTHEHREEPDVRRWVTDARRVGPPRPPGFRVRIKIPK
jgi:cytoskeletal protein RodZ